MKLSSTLFLRLVIVLIGLAVLALCIFILPAGITTDRTGYYRPLLIAMYIPALPFFIALYQGLLLLNYIDHNKVFSKLSIQALKYIKYCATAIGVFYALALPYIFSVADKDDAPGVFLIGLIFTFGPLVIGAFAAILQNLFSNASNIKSENDLIV